MPYISRHTADLVKGRTSIPGARYFLTWVTARRAASLFNESSRQIARQCITSINTAGDGLVLAGTVMPDHIHLLVELGTRLTVSQVVAKTKACITRQSSSVEWQLNFFEHQLRSTEQAEDFAFYIFMNPYCADLCPLDQAWPGWIPGQGINWGFEAKQRSGGLPQPEWIGQAQRFGAALPAGTG